MSWESTIVLSTPKPAFFHVSFGFPFRFWPILKLRSQVLVLCSFVCTKRQVYSIKFFCLSEWNLNPVISMCHWNEKGISAIHTAGGSTTFLPTFLKINAKCKNAMQNAKMQCKVQWGLTSTVLSTTQVNWRPLSTFVCKTRMGISFFAGTSGAEGCSCGLLFYRVSQQLGTSFLLIRCADHIMIKN